MRLKSGQLKKLTSGKKQLRNPSMTLYHTENVSRNNIKCDEEVLVKIMRKIWNYQFIDQENFGNYGFPRVYIKEQDSSDIEIGLMYISVLCHLNVIKEIIPDNIKHFRRN